MSATRGKSGAAKGLSAALFEEDEKPIVIDGGSDSIRCGFAETGHLPHSVFPSVVGRPRNRGVVVGMGGDGSFFGADALDKRGILTIKYPIEHGIVTNWDDMEKIWHHTFYNELRVAPEEHPVLLTETPLTPRANREKATQIMFETFNTPALHLENSAACHLRALGEISGTGVVLDIGATATSATPVESFEVLVASVQTADVGGSHLTDRLSRLLAETAQGAQQVPGWSQKQLVALKEMGCYVLDTAGGGAQPRGPIPAAEDKSFELPDNLKVQVRDEALSACAEALFDFTLVAGSAGGGGGGGIHDQVFRAIVQSHYELHAELYANVVLTGATARLPGLAGRLRSELARLGSVPPADFGQYITNGNERLKPRFRLDVRARSLDSFELNVVVPDDPSTSAWLGAAILAAQSEFQQRWTSKEEYDETGPSITCRRAW